MEFKLKSQDEQTYLYIERTLSLDADMMIQLSSTDFNCIFDFLQKNDIPPLSMPMVVYPEAPDRGSNTVPFRASVVVNSEDAEKARASGTIKIDKLPAGKVMSAMHIGSYNDLLKSHIALRKHIEASNLKPVPPIWDIFLDDYHDVPESELRTEIFRAVT